jgi:hypothetical protein
MTLKSFVAAGVGCGLCTVPAVMTQESDAALPIRAEVIITDESPRFLEKDAPDSPVRLTPIKVAEKGRYGAQVKFYGCTPDQTGQCKAQVLYVLLDSQGHQRFTSGWLRLWYDRPPSPQGEFRIGEEGMGGEIGGDPPGSWEILSIVRDQVSGLMSVSAASLQVPAPLLPVGGSGASHCHKDESVLFSCRTGAKQVSVCSSPDFLRKTGYLAYRFGRPGQRPEMDFQSPGTNPADVFSYFGSGYAKGTTALLQFSAGEFTYQVFSENHVFDWNGSGVVVNRGKERIAYSLCDDKSIVNNLDQLRHFGFSGGEFTDFLDHEPAK